MAYTAPSINDIKARILADMQSELGQPVPTLQTSFLRVLATVLAAVLWLIYKRSAHIQRSIFITTAADSDLDSLAAYDGLQRRPEGNWQGTVTIDRVYALQAGAILRHTGTGLEYIVLSTIAAGGGTTTIRVRARLDGTTSNLEIGDTQLTAVIRILQLVGATFTVATIETVGATRESDTVLRSRLLERRRARPVGGSLIDYQQWAVEVPNIVRATPYSRGTGFVDVYVGDQASNGSPLVVSQSKLDEVAAFIRADTRLPVGASLSIFNYGILDFAIDITGFEPEINTDLLANAIFEYLFTRQPGETDPALGFNAIEQQVRNVDISGLVGRFGTAATVNVSPFAGSVGEIHPLPRGTIAGSRRVQINGVTF